MQQIRMYPFNPIMGGLGETLLCIASSNWLRSSDNHV